MPLAETMAEMVMSSDPLMEARALSYRDLFHKFPSADRERLVEHLICRTTAEIARGDALRQTAQAWLSNAEAPLGRADSAGAPVKSPPRPAQRVG